MFWSFHGTSEKSSFRGRSEENMVGQLLSQGWKAEEEVSGRSCSILFCQLLMPQMWTALVNTSSASSIHSAQLPGTHIWATVLLSLEQSLALHTYFLRWSFHIISLTKVQNLHILKAYIKINTYLCTHTRMSTYSPRSLSEPWKFQSFSFCLLATESLN